MQLLLAVVLDPFVQLFNHRAGPRFIPPLSLYSTLALPAVLGLLILAALYRSLPVVSGEGMVHDQAVRPGLLALGVVSLIALSPRVWLAWTILLVALFAYGTRTHRSPPLQESLNTSGLSVPRLVPGALVSVVGVGLILRAANLAALGPSIDANNHLMRAIGPSFDVTVDYGRADVVSEVVALLFATFDPATFDQHLVVARLPGVVLGTLTAIPVYFIGRLINQRVGLIAAALWSIHPFSITMSRYIREYVYFAFVGTVLLAVGLSLVVRYRGRPLRQLVVVATIGAGMFRYAAFDSASTFRANALLTVAVLSFSALIALFLDSGHRFTRGQLGAGAAASGLLGLLAVEYATRDGSIAISSDRPGLRMWEFYANGMGLVEARPMFLIIIVGLLAVAFLYANPRGKAVILGVSIATGALFFGIIHLWDRYDGVYYTYFLLPTVVVMLAAAFDAGFNVLKRSLAELPEKPGMPKLLGLGAVIVMFPLILGTPNTDEILRTLRSPAPRFVSHMDSREVVSHVQTFTTAPRTTMSTTSYRVTGLLSGLDLLNHSSYQYNDRDRHKKLIENISQSESGVLALDRQRASWSLSVPMDDFAVGTSAADAVCVQYSGQYGDFHLWVWGGGSIFSCVDAIPLVEWLAVSDRSGLLFTG